MDGVDRTALATALSVEAPAVFDPDLPRDAPLEMIAQNLSGELSSRIPKSSPYGVGLRRVSVIVATLGVTAFAASGACRALMLDSLTLFDVAILSVSACLFAWTAFWFFTAGAGLVITIARWRSGLGVNPDGPPPRLNSRTAILAPVYNEDTAAVFARLQAVCESIQATGQGARFDLFVLSDTTDREIQQAERRAFDQLRREVRRGASVFYRHRAENVGRKAGNVADWVRRFGGAYSFMVVLDADSLMTGDTLVRLAGAMERHPDMGLLQTLPLIVNRDSLFGRTLQFSSRLYGPLYARGVAWWSGAEGNYWGHNAIIRVAAFAAHAGLPDLPGPKPLGGEIISHDFVEAALIRRAGYAVHMAPELGGTFEECPPTLDALMKRDRRWCQGNLQHLAMIPADGLHWVSRLHLANGALAYVTAPLWLALLFMSVLAPMWPGLGGDLKHLLDHDLRSVREDIATVGWILVASMALLLAPKALAYGAAMIDPAQRKAFGGPLKTAGGLALEILVSALIAPVMMLSQTRSLIDLVLGRDSGWGAQHRTEGGLSLREAARSHGWHTGAGLALSIGALVASPAAFFWMSPALVGLVFSIPVAMAISHRGLGEKARRLGLLSTPEEREAPEIVVRANQLASDYARPGRLKLLAITGGPRLDALEAQPRRLPPLSDHADETEEWA